MKTFLIFVAGLALGFHVGRVTAPPPPWVEIDNSFNRTLETISEIVRTREAKQ